MASSDLDVSIGASYLAPGDLLHISAQLHDDLGNPLSNVSISLTTNSNAIKMATTDENGTAVFVIHCNSSWLQFGENTLTVSFSGISSSYILPASSDFQIVFQKISTSLDLISFNSKSIEINQTLSLNLSLTTASELVHGGSIHVLLDSFELQTCSIDDTGYFTIELYLSSNISVGSHTLRFMYLGSDRYSASSFDFDFSVTTPLLINVTVPHPLVLGSWGTLYIHTCDLLGRPITSGSLSLSEANSNLSILTGLDSSGDNVVRIPVRGIPGHHVLSLSIKNNEFLCNSTFEFQTIYYSHPEIIFVNSTIQGYARPGQQISCYFKVENETGPWGNRVLVYNLTTSDVRQVSTDPYGYVRVIFDAPLYELTYCLNISTLPSSFELPSSFLFTYKVRVKIPTAIELVEFVVQPVLKEVKVQLQILALNGSNLPNVDLHYSWMSVDGEATSQDDGIVVLHLPIPLQSGTYRLFYEILGDPSIAAASGFYDICIESTEVLASQGVGLGPFISSITLSITIVVVSVIRKRRTMI
ncbi:MAG: hypothetical protein K9W43_08575 [Candidatus Thorarchaeota archaeon]|nr:hypothetical protein [Candidatus Thorarchaeota archaeon]